MNVLEIPMKDIDVIENHRADIGKTHIDELMQSIRQHGVKQPVGVKIEGKRYQLIFGHRRLLACQKLGWETIPCIVSNDVDEQKFHILNLTENLQRNDPSFVELGRGIEKLEKCGLNHAEIGARLGVAVKKIENIAVIYKALPEKHRGKVAFSRRSGPGSRPKGSLPAHIANKVIQLKRHFGLKDKAVDKLIKYIQETDMLVEDIKNLSILLNSGLSIDDAIEKLHEYHIYTVDVAISKNLMIEAMKKAGINSSRLLIKKIVYGLHPPLKKPDFIKV